MSRPRCDHTPAWTELQALFEASGNSFDLQAAFASDPQRFERFSQDAPHVFADLSKNLIDGETEALLLELARQCGVEQHRDAMFAGKPINRTEQRAVMHFLLRNPPLAQYDLAHPATKRVASLASELAQVHTTLDAMLAYAEQVR
ncbi:MAG: glucose-6-phosphate isomerase, partial [Polaromonas sp.]|nr:glucose-6-phosphate isomerase [Polaromonas sp.]